MNQGRIWCVVNPTVGLPLFLGVVLGISLLIHSAVLSHTTWMGAFFQGGAKAKTAAVQTTTAPAGQVASNQ
jgi:light-harvesting protein B-800-850 alpha chain